MDILKKENMLVSFMMAIMTSLVFADPPASTEYCRSVLNNLMDQYRAVMERMPENVLKDLDEENEDLDRREAMRAYMKADYFMMELESEDDEDEMLRKYEDENEIEDGYGYGGQDRKKEGTRLHKVRKLCSEYHNEHCYYTGAAQEEENDKVVREICGHYYIRDGHY